MEKKADAALFRTDMPNVEAGACLIFLLLSFSIRAEKAQHVRNQRGLWDSALNFRIRLQAVLVTVTE